MKTSNVYTQLIYVPLEYDPVVTPFFKDPRLKRLEKIGGCKVTLLRPDDPRTIYCPLKYRTLEVEYSQEAGRYIGFAELLNKCMTNCTKCFPIRSSEIIVKRIGSGNQHLVKSIEMESLRQRMSLTTHLSVESDNCNGKKTARLPPRWKMVAFAE